MVSRKIARHLGMCRGHVEKTKPCFLTGDPWTAGEFELPEAALDADLPNGDGAHCYVVFDVFDRVTQGRRQAAIPPLPPKKNIGVEQ